MMKKFLIISFFSFLLSFNVSAGTDGKNNISAGTDKKNKLSKKSKPVKDCFESLNRATFSLNLGIDKVIFKPVAKA